MDIGGLQKISLIEYPRKISCILFTVGCNFRCPYCYNPDLVRGTCDKFPNDYVFSFLEERQNFLDGVMISGGEPTLQNDLLDFCQKIKNLGFLVGLETNGTNPSILRKLIDALVVDFIAMDVKAPLSKYSLITKVEVDTEKIKESIELIMNSSPDYEFRTTCYPSLTRGDFKKIFQSIKGAKRYALQQFVPGNTLEKVDSEPYPHRFLLQLGELARDYFEKVDLRI